MFYYTILNLIIQLFLIRKLSVSFSEKRMRDFFVLFEDTGEIIFVGKATKSVRLLYTYIRGAEYLLSKTKPRLLSQTDLKANRKIAEERIARFSAIFIIFLKCL